MISGQTPLVIVFSGATVTLLPVQESTAVGKSNVQFVAQLTVLLLAQLINGGVKLVTVIVWLHVLVLPHASVPSQVRVIACGQRPLVTVPRRLIPMLVPLHKSEAVGGSNVQLLPQ